jgi:hypothetical protein
MWQITTSKNWYAQAMGNQDGIETCNLECSISSIVSEKNMLPVPIIAIAADNISNTCQIRNITDPELCKQHLASQNAVI